MHLVTEFLLTATNFYKAMEFALMKLFIFFEHKVWCKGEQSDFQTRNQEITLFPLGLVSLSTITKSLDMNFFPKSAYVICVFCYDAIRKLGRLVLTENVFTYENKFYRQVVGGAMGSAFTLTLANIFMWKWEKQLAMHQTTSNEIYGRQVSFSYYFN